MAKGLSVWVYYPGGIVEANDKALEELASKFGGRRTGSGCMVFGGGERDISFEFKTKEQARKFVKAVGSVKGYGLRSKVF